jgi:membrane protease YdiL (CAAX protease family)
MLEVNTLIDFKQWPDLYKWLTTQEDQNNSLYEALAAGKGFMPFFTSIIVMALIPAIAEEIFFRGFLMNAFNGLFKNMHVSIFITAIIFSMIHMQFMKVIPMFFMAIVLGYAAYWSGTIWTSIVAHFLNNTLAVTLLYNSQEGYAKSLDHFLDLTMVQNVLLGLCVIGLFIYIQRKSTSKTENIYV